MAIEQLPVDRDNDLGDLEEPFDVEDPFDPPGDGDREIPDSATIRVIQDALREERTRSSARPIFPVYEEEFLPYDDWD